MTLTRSDKAEEFYCNRCEKEKKAKLKATHLLANGATNMLCNGCYGFLLAEWGVK